MKTRSQTKNDLNIIQNTIKNYDYVKNIEYNKPEYNKPEYIKPLYEVNIDFDEASRAWKENKVYIGNGSYKYVCQKMRINNSKCGKKCLAGSDYCYIHNKSKKN